MTETRTDSIVGINWGSTNFRAYRIAPDAGIEDALEVAAGVATLDRDGMAALAHQVRTRWPQVEHVYAAGMIGSNIGWTDAGYVPCPADVAQVAAQLVDVRIGTLDMKIVPGLACVRARDGAPDIMRGEETEFFGLLAAGRLGQAPVVALPGTHTKWVSVRDGRIAEFMTTLSGELHDRLSTGGALSSILRGPGQVGAAFADGVREGASGGLGLGALLFGVRARAIRQGLAPEEASSYLRGLLIGAEIADARSVFGGFDAGPIPLVGSGPVCALYRAALEVLGESASIVPSQDAVARGFVELDRCMAA